MCFLKDRLREEEKIEIPKEKEEKKMRKVLNKKVESNEITCRPSANNIQPVNPAKSNVSQTIPSSGIQSNFYFEPGSSYPPIRFPQSPPRMNFPYGFPMGYNMPTPADMGFGVFCSAVTRRGRNLGFENFNPIAGFFVPAPNMNSSFENHNISAKGEQEKKA